MTAEEIFKRVRKIEVKAKGLSQHLFSGSYHSAFKGRGMSFSEVRNYTYGDDVRSIDWNVTARTNSPHVKVFEEERELTMMLLVDISQSSFFGTQGTMKRDFLTEICALLAFSATNNNDKVGLILFSDMIEHYVAPKKGKTHILHLIRMLINIQPQNKATDLNVPLEFLNNVVKKRSICFLLSDFVSPNFERKLNVTARRHDTIGIRIQDPLEAAMPSVGLLQLQDPESGKLLWINTDDYKVKEAYAKKANILEVQFDTAFAKNAAQSIKISTTSSYIHALIRFFEHRK